MSRLKQLIGSLVKLLLGTVTAFTSFSAQSRHSKGLQQLKTA